MCVCVCVCVCVFQVCCCKAKTGNTESTNHTTQVTRTTS